MVSVERLTKCAKHKPWPALKLLPARNHFVKGLQHIFKMHTSAVLQVPAKRSPDILASGLVADDG